jgi:23S rRNA pseudouridine955/2504/2580 synthase
MATRLNAKVTNSKPSTKTDNQESIAYKQVQHITVLEPFAGQRLDNHLIRTLKNLPKSKIYKIIRKGEVRVNKKRAKPEYNIQAGDIIRIPPLMLQEKPNYVAPKQVQNKIENAIIYEDKTLMVINKPEGMAVHGGSGLSFGVIEALRNSRPKEKYLELVHRLDRNTSGCLIIAKKRSTLKHLQSQFIDTGKVIKKYYALVAGKWQKNNLTVNQPLLKNTLKSGERIVVVNPNGKPATTKYRILQQQDNYSLIEAYPLTGRTHQIRVHCLTSGGPILGDDKYNSTESQSIAKQLNCTRLFLHAHSISFKNIKGERLHFAAKLPADLQLVLKQAKINLAE